MNQQALIRKRDAFETKLRKKAHDDLVKNHRQKIISHLESLPNSQTITLDQAIRNLTEGHDIPESLGALIALLGGPLQEREKYAHIMRLIDQGIVYILMNMVIGRRHLDLALALMVAMSSLYQRKTCRSFINSGCLPQLVQLLFDSQGNLPLCSLALNVLGNIAVEDINYRDALMKNGVHTWVIDRVRLQLEHCACIYTEDSDLVVKRYWQFCFWYLQVLGEYAECVFEPHEIVQFAVKFIKPTFPPDIVSLCLSVLNDFSIYLEPCFAEFNEGLRVLVAELTKKEQPYSREVIHSVCYLDKLTFTELQPFCRLINPHYYSKQPSYVPQRKNRFMLCKVLLNNLQRSTPPLQLQDEFFWNDLIIEASASNERAVLIRLLSQFKLERGRDQWCFRFVSGCLSLDTELKEVLAALNFLAVQLQQKDREYVRMQVEKYGIGSHLEQLQRKKNSTIYQKVEQILAFFS